MTRITIDASTLGKFQGLGEYAEVCDQAGRIVGHFYPYVEPPRDPNGRIISPISDEEMERRCEERTGRPLNEILADLQKL
jgi:hypothetical protein